MQSSKRRTAAFALAASLIAMLVAAAPATAGTRAIGIDVSRFQGAINWPSVAGSGVRFAFASSSLTLSVLSFVLGFLRVLTLAR